MAKVTLSQLEKIYAGSKKTPNFRAVKGIDLEVEDKEFMVLVGPSGCGKSTTLRMIAGLEEVTSGTIDIDGRVINDVLPKDRDLAMVFQNYALYPHMTVYNNMSFGLKLRKFPADQIEKRVQEAARILGLENLLERKPKALSGGQRQRVAVGRAIVRKPKVFLFDEPLSNLDAKMRVAMRSEISKLHAKLQATMIYVTHDQVEAMTMGDRICVMSDGEIMQVDTPMNLYDWPANLFVASFIGSPQMNLFKGSILDDAGRLLFQEGGAESPGFRCALDDCALADRIRRHGGREVHLGIRPEDVIIAGSSSGSEDSARYVEATVDLAEPLGSETLVHLNTGSASFTVKDHSRRVPVMGGRLRVCFDERKIHFFDAGTEIAIPPAR